ncbi:unnamed protein product [Victoria cruziana]
MSSMVMDEALKAKAEIYHGDELCREKTLELLKELELPNGILPLEDILEVGIIRETGYVWLKQKKKKEHYFKKISKMVSYNTEVTAYAEKGKFKKMTGVKSKELLIWVTLTDMFVDDTNTKITFIGPGGLGRSFPVSAFQNEEN